MRTAIAVFLVAGLVGLGVPPMGGVASLSAQQGASITGGGFAPGTGVSLVDANGVVIATATADASGNVTFTGVPAGNYSLVGLDDADTRVAAAIIVSGDAAAAGTLLTAGLATAAGTGGISTTTIVAALLAAAAATTASVVAVTAGS